MIVRDKLSHLVMCHVIWCVHLIFFVYANEVDYKGEFSSIGSQILTSIQIHHKLVENGANLFKFLTKISEKC